MSEIVDILVQSKLTAGTFTVDNTQIAVPITAGSGKAFCPDGTSFFEWADSFSLLSIGVTLPFGLVMGETIDALLNTVVPSVFLVYEQQSVPGVWLPLPSATSAEFFLPMDNYEFSAGTWIDAKRLANGGPGEKFSLGALLQFQPMVSMLGVPDSMNGEVISAPVFMKILHNLPLS